MAVAIPIFKPLDPKLNTVGSIVPWTPGVYVCPFCGGPSGANRGCNFSGNYAIDVAGREIKTKIKMTGICTKVAANPANPNGPHNNIIGAKYHRIGAKPAGRPLTNCPFCGIAKNQYVYPCGFDGEIIDDVIGEVKGICRNTPSGVVPAKSAVDAAGRLLAATVLAKPLINCHLCGAWGEDKHRRGCKAGGI